MWEMEATAYSGGIHERKGPLRSHTMGPSVALIMTAPGGDNNLRYIFVEESERVEGRRGLEGGS